MSATPKKKKRKGAATPSAFPRLGWSRSPVGGPQSTKKGKRGYDRKRAKKETEDTA